MSGAACRCGATWTGLRIEHCTACHQTFTGTSAGDRHRVGDHAVFSGPTRRRCLTAEEMRDKGMEQNARGHWTNGGTSPWAAAQCDGGCHERDEDCPLCAALILNGRHVACDDCLFYAAQDALTPTNPGPGGTAP